MSSKTNFSPSTILADHNYIQKDIAIKNVVARWCLHELAVKPIFSHQLMGAGLILEHGRSVRLNVEEEIRRVVGPAATLLQHLVVQTVLAALSNLKNVILSPVQV